jgi:hypothetical protein
MPEQSFRAQFVLFAILPILLGAPPARAQFVSFAPVVTYDSGGYLADSVAVADVNLDGNPDVVVVNDGCGGQDEPCPVGAVGVLLGNGDGSLQAVKTYNSGGYGPLGIQSLAVSDVNGDGKPDIIVANRCPGLLAGYCTTANNTIAVLLGNGDGTFQPAITNSCCFSPFSVAVADLNGDGKPDIVALNGVVNVLLGNGDGTFQLLLSYEIPPPWTAQYLAIADVNRDGKPDLIVTSDCESTPTGACTGTQSTGDQSAVFVMLGNGDGTFQAAQFYNAPIYGSSTVTVTDLNGDGKLDIVVAGTCLEDNSSCPSRDAAASVLLGNGNGTFQPGVTYDAGCCADGLSVAVGDVNGDRKPDLVVSNASSQVGVLLGNGDGTFGTPVMYGSGGFSAYSVALADLNPHSKPDIVVANRCATGTCFADGSVGVLLNTTPPYVTVAGSPQQPLTRNASGDYVARVTITNTGNVTISSLRVALAGTTLGSGSLLSAPAPLKNFAPGASATVTLTFPANSVSAGTATAPLKVSGTYSVTSPSLSGNWGLSFRIVTL